MTEKHRKEKCVVVLLTGYGLEQHKHVFFVALWTTYLHIDAKSHTCMLAYFSCKLCYKHDKKLFPAWMKIGIKTEVKVAC